MKGMVVVVLALLFASACSTNRIPPEIPATVTKQEVVSMPVFHYLSSIEVWGFEETEPRFLVRDYYPQIRQKIVDSHLFRQNPLREGDLYWLDIRWSYRNRDEGVAAATGILRAFTLFLVPGKITMIHTMEIDVHENGRLRKSYRYDKEVEYWSNLMTENEISGAIWFHKGVNAILSQFYEDLNKDGYMVIKGI